MNTSPPPPPPPPGLTCSFVLSCISPGQNTNISTGGIISAGQLVPGPNNGQYTWLSPNGTPLFTFNALIAPLSVQDTPTVDLTLTPANVLSANVNVSAQPGNVIQILPDGLFVSATSINLSVQDTPTIDLTLSAGNVLSASVNISGQPNNQLQVLPDGLYISPASDPCLSSSPNLVNFPTNGLLATYNASTGCLERIVIPPERVVYGEPNGAGSPRADNLRYSPANNFLRATSGPDFPMQHSFMLYEAGSSASGNFYSVIGATTNSSISNTGTSFINIFNAVATATDSVLVGQNLYGPNTSEESVLLFREATVFTAFSSFVTARLSTVTGAAYSFVAAGFGANHSSPIVGSLSITLSNASQPNVNFSSYIARGALNAGSSSVSFSNVNLDSVTLINNLTVAYSTLHLNGVILFDDGLRNEFSFIAANDTNLNSTRYSFFVSDSNPNQTTRTHHSFVSLEQRGSNRVGSGTPFISSSVLIAADVLPDAENTLFISRDPNRWLSLRNSVYVAQGVGVNDSFPPNNGAFLENSVIVGNSFNIVLVPSVTSLTLIGRQLGAGQNTVFGVGFDSYTPPPVLAAGGWLAYIADGGADNANYFQGWASAWRFRMFNPSTNYVNNAAAISALNAAYGTDPRNAIGTMVVAQVAGTPAIFTWNGATFVRITV